MLMLLLCVGCGRYRWVKQKALPFDTLCVKVDGSSTWAPQAQALLARHLRECLWRSGCIVCEDEAQADACLEVRLGDYTASTLATLPDETTVARGLALSLQATCALAKTPSPGQPPFTYFEDHTLVATTHTLADTGPQVAIDQAMVVLTEQLAVQIRDAIYERSWLPEDA